MIERTRHDDATALRLTWWRSRLVGLAVHAFIVRDVLIDTGFPALEGEIAEIVSERRPRGALVTHQHEDHAGNVERLAALGIPLGMSDATRAVVSAEQSIGFYRHFTWRAMRPLRTPHETFHDDSLELVQAPGHSADHHVVWDHQTDSLFAGDLFLGVKVRVAHSYESPSGLVASLRAMANRKPRRVFCAHRGLVPGGAGALHAKADWLEALIARVTALHREGAKASEIRVRALGAHGLVHWFSAGDYSPDNLVRAIIRECNDDDRHAGSA